MEMLKDKKLNLKIKYYRNSLIEGLFMIGGSFQKLMSGKISWNLQKRMKLITSLKQLLFKKLL
jgi:hypothetical protein